MLFGLTLTSSAANQVIEVTSDGTNIMIAVNGSEVNFPDQSPYVSHDRTMVPVRFVSEALGAVVEWDKVKNQVVIEGNKVVELAIGSTTATVNGSPVELDAPPEIAGERTMVPLRFVSEALGVEVKYISSAEISLGSAQELLIDVDISEQKVRIYQAGKLIQEWLASTGVNNCTPLGWFTIQNRGDWFFSEEYQEGAVWWVSFKDWGIYLFHSIPMDRQRTVIAEEQIKLGTPVSHGCVRLATDNAKWIYDNIPSDTPVYIHN